MKKTYEESMKKRILTSIFYIFVSFIVLVVSTWTWYVNNTKVGGEALEISASSSRFDLVTKNGDEESVTTSRDTMDWLLSSDSNIGNYNSGGIGPGDSGSLTFYIRPKVDDIEKLSWTLDFIPCEEISEGEDVEFTAKYGNKDLELKKQENEKLSNLLSGHIMFFQEITDDSGKTSYKLIDSEKISVDLSDKAINEDIKVTIHWVWPLQVDYYIQTGEFLKTTDQVETMVEKMNENKNLYFNGFDESLVVKPFADMNDEEKNSLRNYYNLGDEYIGQNAKFTKLTVTVQE